MMEIKAELAVCGERARKTSADSESWVLKRAVEKRGKRCKERELGRQRVTVLGVQVCAIGRKGRRVWRRTKVEGVTRYG